MHLFFLDELLFFFSTIVCIISPCYCPISCLDKSHTHPTSVIQFDPQILVYSHRSLRERATMVDLMLQMMGEVFSFFFFPLAKYEHLEDWIYKSRSAIGFACTVTLRKRISCRGRYFSSTGTFSIASKVVSAPSMTLRTNIAGLDYGRYHSIPQLIYQ